jgi:mono/diheme cytochrome c family protein
VDTNQVILAVGTAVLVVFSLTVALVVPKRNPDFPGRKLGVFLGVSATLVIGMLLLVGFFGSEDAEEEAGAAVAETTPAEGGAPEGEGGETAPPPAETGAPAEGGGGAPAGDAAAGKAVFDSAGCAGCHTLADAGASGAVGPNLDDAQPPHELVVDRVTNGAGAMPSFAGQLSEQQIQDVAANVVQATSG